MLTMSMLFILLFRFPSVSWRRTKLPAFLTDSLIQWDKTMMNLFFRFEDTNEFTNFYALTELFSKSQISPLIISTIDVMVTLSESF